jgi:hypothetical protein
MDLQNEVLHSIELELNLLDPEQDIPLLKGEWVGIGIDFPDGIEIEGIRDNGYSFSMTLPPVFVVLGNSDGFTIGEESYLIEIGSFGWISSEDFLEQADVMLESEDPLVYMFQDNLNNLSALYVDSDEDGEIDDDERESTVASGEEYGEDIVVDEDPTDGITEEDFPDLEGGEEWDEWDHGTFEQEEETTDEEASGCGGGMATIAFPVFALISLNRRRRKEE